MFVFPQSLFGLRDYLKGIGVDVTAFKSARQAAFMAQQLLSTRVKFPPSGQEMLPTLLTIQKAVPARGIVQQPTVSKAAPADLFGISLKPGKAKGKPSKKAPQAAYLAAFSTEAVASGVHIFADGAAVPNPGAGGWGIVAYEDGKEIHSEFGGEPDTTNNVMELTGLLEAIRWALQRPALAVTIWCDSQYAVKGANEWRHNWKAKGWKRGGRDAKEKNQYLANVELWMAIDEALTSAGSEKITINWVKGHAGHIGNERADELAEMGRASVHEEDHDYLTAEYRRVMA